MRNRIISILMAGLLLLLVLFTLVPSNAQESQSSKTRLEIGYIWMDLTGSIYDSTSNTTTDIGNLGLGKTTSPWIAIEKQVYNERSFVGLSFFSYKDDSTVTLTSNVALPNSSGGNVIFPAGTSLYTTYKYYAIDIYYKSFFQPYNPDQGGIYLLGGLRFNNLKATSSDGARTSTYEVKVPTFYLGLGGDYKLAENLRAYGYVSGFSGSSSDGKGNLMEYELGLTYSITENVDLGLGYKYMKYNLEDSNSNKLDSTFKGFKAMFRVRF